MTIVIRVCYRQIFDRRPVFLMYSRRAKKLLIVIFFSLKYAHFFFQHYDTLKWITASSQLSN